VTAATRGASPDDGGEGAGIARRGRAEGATAAADASFDALVADARAGDEAAWRALVGRLSGVVWRTVNSFRIAPADREDAFASAFYQLSKHLNSVHEPERLPGWMATTARREALALVRAHQRLVPSGEGIDLSVEALDFDEGLLDGELQRAASAALRRLRPQDQALLRLLTAEPRLTYEEISKVLGIPHGSIGPTRQRCLAQLRRSPELAPFFDNE
jgi:RNA polymerase sigma factor (sigma-70 family)